MAEQDYYDLLGVPRAADEAAIKAAYRRLAKECHPDTKNGCKESEARFKAINEAYDVLKDPQKRAAYDRFGRAAEWARSARSRVSSSSSAAARRAGGAARQSPIRAPPATARGVRSASAS